MSEFNLALALLGALVLALGVISDYIKKSLSVLSEPILSVAFGVVIGPAGLELLRVGAFGDPMAVLEQATRLTLGIAVMGVAIRLPNRYVFERARAMTVVLLVIMPGTWLVSGVLANAFFGIPWWTGMLVGAVLTPTDPVIAGSIVTGTIAEEHVPARLRHYISAESAINDGIAYLFVFLPILILQRDTGSALRAWLLDVLLAQVVIAVLFGFVIGYLVGRVQYWARRHEYVLPASLLTIVVALTFGVLGFVKLFGANGILAAFAAGVGFKLPTQDEADEREAEVQEALERIFEIPVFVLFGTMLPWQAWFEFGWRGVAFTAVLLMLRRLPIVLPASVGLSPVRSRADRLFAGWFGPIGIAAVFYATLVVHETGSMRIWGLSSLVIAASILAYGASATPFTLWYGVTSGGDSDRTG